VQKDGRIGWPLLNCDCAKKILWSKGNANRRRTVPWWKRQMISANSDRFAE